MRRPRLFLPLLLLATAVALPAHAQRGPQEDPRARGGRELSDTVRRVERRTGGEVLSAEQVQFDGRDVHRVKVLEASGRVRVYMDDPRPERGPPRTRDDDD